MPASPSTTAPLIAPDQSLKSYAIYRVALALLLVGLCLSDWGQSAFGIRHPALFLSTSLGYLVIASASLAGFSRLNYLLNGPTLFFTLLVDILAITLITHASKGLDSGLGLLLITVVAAGSVFARGQLALLIAAMASLTIMVEQGISIFIYQESNNFMPAGILGILLFLTALIFRVLATRARTAQELALTKTSQAEHLLELNEAIIKRMQTGIIVVSRENQIQLINNAAIQLLGGQKLGRPINVGQTLRVIPELQQKLDQWRQYPWVRPESFSLQGSEQELQANFAEMESGYREQTLIFLEDHRAFVQHAQQLKLSSLGRLTGSIAHEIRNPLGAISHASQLLQESDTENKFTRLTDIIQRHSQRVNVIVENVMDLSRQKAPRTQKIMLSQWIKNFRADYLDNESNNGDIQIIADPGDIQVSFDPTHLSQVIHNLIDNALRYNEQQTGERAVTVQLYTDSGTQLPKLDVIDRGPGISEQNADRLFEPFFTTRHEGSGLGLYLAKELCELNLSPLSYHENPEGGAIFRIEFCHPDRLLPKTERS